MTVLANDFTYDGTTTTLTDAYVYKKDDGYVFYLTPEDKTNFYFGCYVTTDLFNTTITLENDLDDEDSYWKALYENDSKGLYYYGESGDLDDITSGTLYVNPPADEDDDITLIFDITFEDGTTLNGAYHGEIYEYNDYTSSGGRMIATGKFKNLLK